MFPVDDNNVRKGKEEITKLELEIMALVQDVERCRGPFSYLDEMNSVLNDKFEKLKYMIANFHSMAQEQASEVKKVSIYKATDEFKRNASEVQKKLKKANLTCILAIESDCKSSLFQHSSTKSPIKKEKNLNTAFNLTQSMSLLTRNMAEQV